MLLQNEVAAVQMALNHMGESGSFSIPEFLLPFYVNMTDGEKRGFGKRFYGYAVKRKGFDTPTYEIVSIEGTANPQKYMKKQKPNLSAASDQDIKAECELRGWDRIIKAA